MSQLRQSLHLMPQVPLSCQGCALRSPRSGLHLLVSYNIRISSAVLIPLSETNTVSAGANVPQSDTVSHINGKIMEIPVVHSHDFCSKIQSTVHFPLIMSFYQSIQPQLLCQFPKRLFNWLLSRIAQIRSTAEAPKCFCLVEHVLIYCKNPFEAPEYSLPGKFPANTCLRPGNKKGSVRQEIAEAPACSYSFAMSR